MDLHDALEFGDVLNTNVEDLGEQLSDCCGAPAEGGVIENNEGFCKDCKEGTTFEWIVDNIEINASFDNRSQAYYTDQDDIQYNNYKNSFTFINIEI